MKIQVNDTWRITICPANHQWVLEARRGKRWHPRSFFRTREALLRVTQQIAGTINPEAWQQMQTLPLHFKPIAEALGGAQERREEISGTHPPEEQFEASCAAFLDDKEIEAGKYIYDSSKSSDERYRRLSDFVRVVYNIEQGSSKKTSVKYF
ncbi:hypothetical protein [Rhodovulum steppense]|uniref:hypothetical protein n=1 Tax=Rhodovulum steppense TaxID=540251 RepID=UPI0010454652|nr:hypothetical protein [Rhodovulum steppense]